MDELGDCRSSASAVALQDIDVALYSWIGRQCSLRPDVAAHDLGRSREQVLAGFRRLLEARLVRRSSDDPTVGFAVSPESALADLSAPLEARIRGDQHELSLLRTELSRFSGHYHGPESESSSFEIIDDLQSVRAALNAASDNCQTEMISAQPGGGARVPEAMKEAAHRDRRLLERGVRVRTLYHHTARFNAPSQAYVAFASSLGAQYRTAHALFGRIIAFDRRTAFIPLKDGSWGAVVIREVSTVNYLWEIFELSWDLATPFSDAATQGLEQVSRETHETIIRMLASGVKDETIARRLGMSLRTARRHIAEIMNDLNAASRFQAGAAAVLKGYLKTDESHHQ